MIRRRLDERSGSLCSPSLRAWSELSDPGSRLSRLSLAIIQGLRTVTLYKICFQKVKRELPSHNRFRLLPSVLTLIGASRSWRESSSANVGKSRSPPSGRAQEISLCAFDRDVIEIPIGAFRAGSGEIGEAKASPTAPAASATRPWLNSSWSLITSRNHTAPGNA